MKTAISDVKMIGKIILSALLLFWVITTLTGCATAKVDPFDQLMQNMAPKFFIEEGGSEE